MNADTAAGRRALITGAAGGLGRATATALAEQGYALLLADRDPDRGQQLQATLASMHPQQPVEFRQLDLASLDAVQEFASAIVADGQPLDALINIAGILPPPQRATTADGFELKFGINHLGHFALTGRLLEALLKSPAPRVVSIASIVAARGRIRFDDPQFEQGYASQPVYCQAKLACLLFALELDRRAAGTPLVSVAAHPGIARTGIGDERRDATGKRLRDRAEEAAMRFAMRWLGQDAEGGALPIIHAASDPGVSGGRYYGPGGFAQFRGPAAELPIPRSAADPEVWRRLWDLSAELTGVDFAALAHRGAGLRPDAQPARASLAAPPRYRAKHH